MNSMSGISGSILPGGLHGDQCSALARCSAYWPQRRAPAIHLDVSMIGMQADGDELRSAVS